MDLEHELTLKKTKHLSWKLTKFVATHRKNEWSCPNNHTIQATTKHILTDPPCRLCKNEKNEKIFSEKKRLARLTRENKRNERIREVSQILADNGFRTLSVTENGPMKFTYICKRDHVSTLMSTVIKNVGAGCKECLKSGYEEIHKIIDDNQGRLVMSTGESAGDILTIDCKNGHRFEVTNRNLRRRNTFCLECKERTEHKKREEHRERLNQKRKDKQEERKRMALEHAERKGGSVVWVKGHKVLWRCREGHEWLGSVGKDVTNDIWCRKCMFKEFYRDDEVGKVLDEEYPGMFRRNYRPRWLRNPKTGWPLELGFYSDKEKIAIEVNGRQHYEYSPPFHRTSEDLKYTKYKDGIKSERCEEMGVKLIVIPYTMHVNEVKDYIFSQIGFSPNR